MPATDSIDSIDALTAAAARTVSNGAAGLRWSPAMKCRMSPRAAAGLHLFGNAGSNMWAAFSASDEYRDGRPDPLNRWSARIGEALARRCGARALFPFGAPPRPFLKWAKRAEALQNSQLGMLIHPQVRLWHAYRFALAFADGAGFEAPPPAAHADICARCAAKPCLQGCPVNAFTPAGYDVQVCVAHLESAPHGPCMTRGCQARLACPQGAGFRYQADHAAFHMRAFAAAMRAGRFASG